MKMFEHAPMDIYCHFKPWWWFLFLPTTSEELNKTISDTQKSSYEGVFLRLAFWEQPTDKDRNNADIKWISFWSIPNDTCD